MPRFFLDKDALTGSTVLVTGTDARHMACSLRMTVGDEVILCDKEGTDHLARLIRATPEAVTLELLSSSPSRSEPPYAATLYQCLPKGDKMETIIQKAVECGVSRVVPVASSRCIVKLDKESASRKIARWQKIADEAAGQCGRGRLVTVAAPLSFESALSDMVKDVVSFLCYESEEEKTLRDFLPPREQRPATLSFLVGPEGGLSPGEVEAAREKGVASVGLGRRILRTETASSFVLAVFSAFYEI